MLPYIDGIYGIYPVYYTAGRIARKISRPAAGRIDTAKFICCTAGYLSIDLFKPGEKSIQLQNRPCTNYIASVLAISVRLWFP